MSAVLVLFALKEVFAEPTQEDAKAAALWNLKIDSATVTLAQRDATLVWTAPDGNIFSKDLSPRTIVKMVLSPAKGSYIHVEIWLPDAAKWNGRFLGLGNGAPPGASTPAASPAEGGWFCCRHN